MHQKKSHNVGMLNIIYSSIVIGVSKVTTFVYDCYFFVRSYFKFLWQSVKNIYSYMEWGAIWQGIKLMAASVIICWKLASDETKMMKANRQRIIEENIRLKAPQGFVQQAKYNLVLANF